MDIKQIMREITLFIDTYTTEGFIYVLLFVGILFVLLGIFLPKNIALSRIDLKRMLNPETSDIVMSDKVRYFHTLSRTGIWRTFLIQEDSKTYKEYEGLIKKAGGLNGMTPDVINVLNYLSLFGILTTGVVGITVLSFLNIDVDLLTSIAVISVISALGFLLPEFMIKSEIKKRNERLVKELDTIQLFMVIYLGAGYNVYDMLMAISEVTVHSKKYFKECLNEYYVDAERAIQKMADKITLEEYQLLANIMKQALNVSGENMVRFVDENMQQMKKAQELSRSAANKKRPLQFVFLLALPLISVIIIWFYPLFKEIMSLFSDIGGI